MFDYDEKEELTKEVYANFGLAYYYSECLHRSACIMFVFNGSQKGNLTTKPRVEEKLKHSFSLTLGHIYEKIKEILPETLQDDMEDAVNKRNYLAHHFWFERAHLLWSIKGLQELNDELMKMGKVFESLDNNIEVLIQPMMKSFGLDDKILKEELEKVISGEPWEPLPNKRYPKKQERIVKAWNIPGPNKAFIVILQSEDGLLWQFCDIGLGWSAYDVVQSDWQINERIQQYLPAIINPRPSTSKPWNYEFTLANKVVLKVTLEESTKTLRYRLK